MTKKLASINPKIPMIRELLIACLFLGPSLSVAEPVDLVPGSIIPGVARLLPGCRRYLIYERANGEIRPRVTMTRMMAAEGEGESQTFKVVQTWISQSGVASDTSVSRFLTLEPVSFAGVQQGNEYDLRFDATGVFGVRTARDGSPLPYRVEFNAPTYNEVIDDVMVSALPLREGYSIRYRAFNPGDEPRLLTIQVMGSERIPLASGGSADTWVVRELGIHQLVVTWWFAKDTREQLKMRVVQPDGSEYWRVRLYDDGDASCR